MKNILVLLIAAFCYGQGNVTVGGGNGTIRNGTADPSSCTAGRDLFINRSSTPVLKLCTATNTWTPIASDDIALVAVAVTASTSATLTHNFGSKDHLVGCFNASDVDVIPLAVTRGANADTITFDPAFTGRCVAITGGGGSGGSMTYPGAGVPKSTGSAWETSYTVGTSANNLVQLTAAAKLPAVDGSLLTNLPSGGTIYTSTGIAGAGTSGDPIRIDPSGGAASQALYSANLTGWGTIAANSCTEKNITATGAVAGESVTPGWPATLPANLTGIIYAATNLVVVRVCNITATGIAVADGLTFSGRIVRGF